MIFNIVFGFWVFILFATIVTMAQEKEEIPEIRSVSYLRMIGTSLAIITIMAIISKLV